MISKFYIVSGLFLSVPQNCLMSAIEEVGLDLVADWKKLTEQEYQDQFKNMSLVPTVRTRTRIKKKNKSFRVLFKNIILVRR